MTKDLKGKRIHLLWIVLVSFFSFRMFSSEVATTNHLPPSSPPPPAPFYLHVLHHYIHRTPPASFLQYIPIY